MGRSAILTIQDDAGRDGWALGPNGNPIVFDETTGVGAECCCGGAPPNPCCFDQNAAHWCTVAATQRLGGIVHKLAVTGSINTTRTGLFLFGQTPDRGTRTLNASVTIEVRWRIAIDANNVCSSTPVGILGIWELHEAYVGTDGRFDYQRNESFNTYNQARNAYNDSIGVPPTFHPTFWNAVPTYGQLAFGFTATAPVSPAQTGLVAGVCSGFGRGRISSPLSGSVELDGMYSASTIYNGLRARRTINVRPFSVDVNGEPASGSGTSAVDYVTTVEQACNVGSLTGPGASGVPIDPGIAEFLRRQAGCVGCGG